MQLIKYFMKSIQGSIWHVLNHNLTFEFCQLFSHTLAPASLGYLNAFPTSLTPREEQPVFCRRKAEFVHLTQVPRGGVLLREGMVPSCS